MSSPSLGSGSKGALCVEARFARDLIIEIEEAGFEITR
jgi:hypothetical protein